MRFSMTRLLLSSTWNERTLAYLTSPADFAGADDIITNLAKGREPGDNERTP